MIPGTRGQRVPEVILRLAPRVASRDAELGEFIAIGVGLLFGTLGPSPQVGTQLVAVAGSISAEAGPHLLRIGADPARRGFGGCLRAAGFLLREPGGLFCLRGHVAGLVPVGLADTDPLAGLGAGLPDHGIPVRFGGCDPRGGVLAVRLGDGVPFGFGSGTAACASAAAARASAAPTRRLRIEAAYTLWLSASDNAATSLRLSWPLSLARQRVSRTWPVGSLPSWRSHAYQPW
jgi:hypothetical protein